MKISTSILSCSKIVPVVKELTLTDTDYLHIDLIDNTFVKGTVIPFRKIKKLYKITSKKLDVHLMVENPKKYIKKFALLNTEYLTFHVELGKNIESNLEMVRNYGMKCGLAINPDTEFDVLKPYLEMVDIILVMSVIPGYGGQAFMPEVLDKVKVIKDYIKEHKLDIVVSIDGGINNETGKVAKDAGSDILIAGSYITNGNNYQEKIDELRNV